jgi:Ca2+-dependent lipid-binding protein
MCRSTIRGQKEKEKEKEKEKQQQKEKAFNPSIENDPEVEGQSHIQKTIDVKVVVVSFWNVQNLY